MPTPSRYYSSNAAKTTLADSISSSATSLTLSAASNLPAQYPYTLILEKDTANEEVIEVTGLVGSSYQITRNIDSSGAKAHAVGANVEHGVSARDFTESRAHEVATTDVHGISGDFVGTGGSQTITGTKTLSAAIITAAGTFNANSNRITNVPTTPTSSTDAVNQAYVTSISGSAAAAASSATAAATSAASAATSATSAATSASSAATSFSSASTQATAAATSATSAAASATAAATSATSAAASATAANTSQSSASTFATSAATSATSAATSATSAADSATAAASSATAAASSATAAATSATSASSSATSVAGQVASGLVRDMGDITSADNSTGTWISLSSLETNTQASATAAATSATSAAISASSASTSASSALTSQTSAATSASSAATSATSAAASATAAAGYIPTISAGVNGYFLTNNGTTASWSNLSDWGTL